MISRLIDLYVSRAKSLADLGLHESALPLDDAIGALELISALNWTVLGGDIYRCIDGSLELAHMDWSCAEGVDAQSTVQAAREHLSRRHGSDLYVVFVLTTSGRPAPFQGD